MRKWVTGLALACWVAGGLEAQPLTGGLLGRPTADYRYIPAPSGCVASSVPIFLGSPVALGCDSGLTYDAGTDTLTSGNLYYNPVTHSTAVGGSATDRTSAGIRNVGIGYLALGSSVSGDDNLAIGTYALQLANGLSNNVAVGTSALRNGTTGGNSVGIGTAALIDAAGVDNVGIGGYSGGALTSVNSYRNTLVGAGANILGEPATNRTAIGYATIATANNQVVLGNASVTEVQLGMGGVASGTAAGYAVLGANGEIARRGYASELLTLNTGGTTTVTAASIVPAGARITGIVYRITTAIATATAFTVKPTGGALFATVGTATTSQSTLTVNTTGTLVPVLHADQYSSTANTLTVDTTGTPSAGVIRLTVFYEQLVPGTT